jgi:hypothetical protein
MNKDRKYRIVELTYYNRGEAKDSTYYEVHFLKKFLWIKWWSPLTEPNYDHNSTIRFETLSQAEDLLEKHKNGNPINGWKERIVYADPDFQTIKK